MSTSHYSSRPYQGPQHISQPNKPRRSIAYACGLGALLVADIVALGFVDCLVDSLVVAGLAILTTLTMARRIA